MPTRMPWSDARYFDELPEEDRNKALRGADCEVQWSYLVFGYEELPDDIIASALKHARLADTLVKQLSPKLQDLHKIMWEL